MEWIREQEQALLDDADELGVIGTRAKLEEAHRASLKKVISTWAEIRFANMLARLGFAVEVLEDRAFSPKNDAYTPDLLASRKDEKILVEVVRTSNGRPDVMGKLGEALVQHQLPFRVEVEIGESLSSPRMDKEGREDADNAITRIVDKVVEHLRGVDATEPSEFSFDDHLFVYGPSSRPTGYVACWGSAAYVVDREGLEDRLLRELERKANRRRCLPDDRKRTPFVVACMNQQPEMCPTTVSSSLTGSRLAPGWMDEDDPVMHPPHVMAALQGPWRNLLEGWDFGLDAKCRISEYGALCGAPWAKQLSGVIVGHSTHFIQWFPNPFAAPEIRDLRLLDLGLPLAGFRPTHPSWVPYP